MAGREYWSRRFPRGTANWGWFGKLITHRKERREAKRLEREGRDQAELERLTREVHAEFDRLLADWPKR